MPKIVVAVLLSLWAVPAWSQTHDLSASAPQGAPASFASLFRDLGRDVRRLPSRQSALLLGAAGALSLGVRSSDADVTEDAHASAALDMVFESGAAIGSGFAQFGAAFGTWALGRATRSPRVSLLGADMVRAQIVSSALTQGVKFAVRRERPDGGRFSFPSGHTSASFASAAVLQRHYGWKVGVPAYGVAAYVAESRLQENRHYLSDVIFGAAIGIASGHAVTVGHGHARFAMTPLAAPGGGGLGLTLIGER